MLRIFTVQHFLQYLVGGDTHGEPIYTIRYPCVLITFTTTSLVRHPLVTSSMEIRPAFSLF